MEMQTAGEDERVSVCRDFERHDFQNDPDFRAGLPSIMSRLRGSKLSKEEINELIERAQWFYYAQLNPHEISWEEFKAWRLSQLQTSVGEQAAERLATLDFKPGEGTSHENQPLSFARLCELISQGRTNEIPGIKEIPEELNSAPATVSRMKTKAKPWERQQA